MYVCQWCFSLIMVLYFCITDPEEVDKALLQLCSSQLKLLQLYTDIQNLHSAADIETCSENVNRHTHISKHIESFSMIPATF